MALEISAVTTRAEIDEFIRLPSRLYRGLPGFVSPLTLDRRSILDPRKGAFFKHGKVQFWLARRDGQAVGRISAQIDHVQPDGAFDDAGLFGSFDAIDDDAVTGALLATAEAWLRANGKTRAAGPFLLSMNGEPGLLIKGQEEPPLTMVSWHPTYLARHLELRGYEGIKDLHYWRISKLEEKLDALNKRRRPTPPPKGIAIRRVNMKDIAGDVEIIRQMFNDGWTNNWGFVPLQPEDIAGIVTEMKPFIKPEFGIIMQDRDDIAAVAMIIPNLYEITADLGADPSISGWIKLGWRTFTHRFRTGFVILLGISKRYRNSVGGAVIAMTMVDEIINRMLRYEDKTGWLEAGWVLDNNVPLQKILRRQGFEIKREMRIYGKELAGTAPSTATRPL